MYIVVMHCGDSMRLCTSCLEKAFDAQLDSVRTRGEAWAAEFASSSVKMTEWPSNSDTLRVVARIKVHDLGMDPRLIERLSLALVEAARERWLALQRLRSGCEH